VLLALSLVSSTAFARRMIRSPEPLVELRTFRDRNFAVGCLLSFVLGIGVFGSVYLMPVFLAYVRTYNPLQIGQIILVTGIAQLISAPIAVALEQRFDERYLTACGFLLFGIGLGLSCSQTSATDFHEMFWPQVVRGVAIMFCILPPTRLALGHMAKADIPDASGLFNLMRNLGGAIGIAIIDTVIYARIPVYSKHYLDRLGAGDLEVARMIGVSPESLLDPAAQAVLTPLIHKAAFVQAINDAWALVALMTLAVLIVVPFARTTRRLPIRLVLQVRGRRPSARPAA
jgi:DHA2 family multidrug resistance protein